MFLFVHVFNFLFDILFSPSPHLVFFFFLSSNNTFNFLFSILCLFSLKQYFYFQAWQTISWVNWLKKE